jgi:hypothetical protein
MACAVCLGSALNAAVPAPEQILPQDTLVAITIPDYAAARSAWRDQALIRLWGDSSLKPFREKFENQWRKEVLGPLEEQVGVRLADQVRLLQGQITFAVVANGWPKTAGRRPGWLMAIDTRDRGADLADQLASWKTRLTESGRKTRSEKIRDREFVVVSIRKDELAGALSTGQKPTSTGNGTVEVWFGQSDSVLWLGDQRDLLDQALARQTASDGSTLKSNPDFVTASEAGIGSAQAYAWVHLSPLVDFVSDMTTAADGSGSGAMGMLEPSKLLPALGLQGLRSLSVAVNSAAEGMTAEVRIGIPESSRTGLFKMILPGRRQAGPPEFVSADTTRFQRLRVDLGEAWAALEAAVYSILPTARSVVDLMFQSVGKDQDPNYDLRRELIGNLGDDIIFLEQPPVTNTLAALSSAPSLILIGSKSPEKVAGALRTLAGLLPPPMNVLRQREVSGRSVYSLALPQEPGTGSDDATRWFSFGAGADYVALSGDVELLEGYLRGADSDGKPLAGIAGLNEAASKVGGMNSGWFGYENDRAMAQSIIDALRQDSASIESVLSLTPAGEALEKSGGLTAWTDFSLLPPFERISKYFHFSVYGLDLRDEDFGYRMFSPTPPGLRP